MLVTIINRNFVKTFVSARCLNYYSYCLLNSNKQTVNRDQNGLIKLVPVATCNTSFQCRYKYNKSSSEKGAEEEVGTPNTI